MVYTDSFRQRRRHHPIMRLDSTGVVFGTDHGPFEFKIDESLVKGTENLVVLSPSNTSSMSRLRIQSTQTLAVLRIATLANNVSRWMFFRASSSTVGNVLSRGCRVKSIRVWHSLAR